MTEKEFLEKHSEGWTWDAIEPVRRSLHHDALEVYRQVLGPGAVFLSCSVVIHGDDRYQIEIGSWPTRRYENDDDVFDPSDVLDSEPRWVSTDILWHWPGATTTTLQEKRLTRARTGATFATYVWTYQTGLGSEPVHRDATMREIPRQLDRVLDQIAVRVLANLQRESRIAKQAKLIAEAAKGFHLDWKVPPR